MVLFMSRNYIRFILSTYCNVSTPDKPFFVYVISTIIFIVENFELYNKYTEEKLYMVVSMLKNYFILIVSRQCNASTPDMLYLVYVTWRIIFMARILSCTINILQKYYIWYYPCRGMIPY